MAPARRRRIEYMPVDELVSAPRNPKLHARDDLRGSIDRFGYVEPIVLDERTQRIVSGHGRRDDLLDRQNAGTPYVDVPDGIEIRGGRWFAPVMRGWSSVDDGESEAFLIAVNQIGPRGGWDVEQLSTMLDEIRQRNARGLTGVGYTLADLERMRGEIAARKRADDKPADPPIPSVPKNPKTRRGDVWILGDHRIMCGDCRDANDVDVALDGQTIGLAITSPPYAQQRDYDTESEFEPVPPDEYVGWFAPVVKLIAERIAADGSWFVNIKPNADGLDTEIYVFDLVAAHVREWGWHFATEFCWQRIGVPKSVTRRFKNQFEPVYQFTRGDWKMRADRVRHLSDNALQSLGPGSGNTSWGDGVQGIVSAIDPARRRRRNSQVMSNADSQGANWEPGDTIGPGLAYPGNMLPTFVQTHEATGHPAAFPVGLPEWFVTVFSDPTDCVYDPFCGSGSTILAAHHQGRRGVGMEISAGYCDVICRRFETHTGIVPIRNGKPRSFVRGPTKA